MSHHLSRLFVALLVTAMPLAAPHAAQREQVVVRGDKVVQQFLEAALRDNYPRILKSLGSTLVIEDAAYEQALQRSLEATISALPADCDGNRLRKDLCGMRPANIPTTSMAPSLQVGDNVMTIAPSTARSLQRGDVIVFRTKSASSNERALQIYRIVGLPGETIGINNGTVEVDGRQITRELTDDKITTVDHVTLPIAWETTPEGRRYRVAGSFGNAPMPVMDNVAAVKIPARSYYVLGDNRENAVDSRFPERLGTRFVTASSVVGRVVVVSAAKDTARIGLKAD